MELVRGNANVNIDGGAIDGTTIGGTTPAAVTATVLAASSSSEHVITRTNAADAPVDALRLRQVSSANMTDGSGPVLAFDWQDSAAGPTEFGNIRFDRDGADDNARFQIQVLDGGVLNSALRLSDVGVLSVDLAGGGAAAQVDLFDDYDDVAVLRGYFNPLAAIREQTLAGLVEMGIVTEVPESRSGYHWNVQAMFALLAGGVYQTRERLEDEVSALKEQVAELKKLVTG